MEPCPILKSDTSKSCNTVYAATSLLMISATLSESGFLREKGIHQQM